MSMPTKTLPFILYFARKQAWKFIFVILACFAWAFNDAFYPYFLKEIVNSLQNYSGNKEEVYSLIKWPLGFLILSWIGSDILQRAAGMLQIYIYPRFRADIRETVFDYVQSHSHQFFSTHFSGNLAKRIADLTYSAQTILEIITYQFITTIIGAVIVLVLMWKTNPIFAGILFAWMFIHLALTSVFLKYCNHLWVTHSDAVSMLSGKIVDVFTNIFNVRLFARNHYENEYLRAHQQEEIQKAKKAMWSMELIRVGLGINGVALIIGMVFTLLHGWVKGWVSLGDFTQISMQSFWILGWIWFVSYQMMVFAREMGVMSNALSLIRHRHEIIDKPNVPALQVPRGTIEFQSVLFGYQPENLIFNQLSVHIPAGQKVGLVGFSGSGKSTFVSLLLRFYDIQSGTILIDGQNISDVTQHSLRANIAMIPQDPSLFHRSLMENIRYGRLDASDDEVIRAAKLAHCHEFIMHMSERYDTLVGERGVKLSGGQRQRIAIARAILKDAPILILDEATSSLDSVTEKLIQKSLAELMKDRTTIVIAHRLSTLADMDRILVFDNGTIVEDGTHTQLLAAKGHFTRLWSMQQEGFLPETFQEAQEV